MMVYIMSKMTKSFTF